MEGEKMAMDEGNKEPTSPMESEEKSSKEGTALLGSPTFIDLGNGRFKSVETGHELLAKDMESYGTSKRCRLGLIDHALQQKKSPLNLFKQHPNFKSKVICKLTGDTINKSEEHIWKHINGRRFLHKLEEKEANKGRSEGMTERNEKPPAKLSKLSENGTKKKKKEIKRKDLQEKKTVDDNSNEKDPMFWSPPVGSRWDFDDGNDCWESCSSDHEMDEDIENDEENQNDSESDEPAMRTKRAPEAVELSSSTSRKKSKSSS